ncbi:MAG TPA: hemolysin family protein [Acidimicrobiia bacterium]|nr:hemolysin family protein [Acidimicrobiia bacterium]
MLLTAFFVAGEFALVAVDRSRVRRLATAGNRWAARVERSLGQLSFELSGAQLGITVTSLLTGAIAEPALAGIFAPLLDDLGWIGPRTRPVITIALALLVANVASMLVGELVPKNFAIAKPFGTAVVIAVPMSWLNRLARPVILFLNRAANWTVRRLGIEPREDLAGVRSLEELELMIRSSGEEGELDDAELSLLTRAIAFTEKVAADIMVSRVSVDALSRHDSVSELRRLARETGHSRFPVFAGDLDEIVGVVHVKDSFKVQPERRSITPVSHIAKPALAVPDSRRLNDLLIDMQRQSRAMAIVVDEYGGTAGIVTIEDLLEELLGEIADEHDPVESQSVPTEGERRIEVSGQLNRHDLDEQFGLVLGEGHFETLGGFLTAQLGRFPTEGEVTGWQGWYFEILAMDGRRVERVAILPPVEKR